MNTVNMANVITIIAISTILCSVSRHNVDAAMKSFKISHEFLEEKLMLDDYSFKEGRLVYAVCNGSAYEKNCTIMQEQYPSGKLLRFCNILLEVYEDDAKLTDKIYVVAYGQDNAILFWDEIGSTTFFKLMVVNLNDHCLTGGFALPDPNMSIYDQLRFGHKILTYNYTADIIIKDPSMYANSNDTESVLSINSRGFWNKPADLVNSGQHFVEFISTIATRSPAKGYVYSKVRNDEYALAIIKPNRSEKLLASYNNHPHTAVSANSGTISFCVRENMTSNITCTQFDEDGNVKSNTTLNYDDLKGNVWIRTLHTSPRGGFLLMLTEYGKSDEDKNSNGFPHYIIIRVNDEGKRIGSVRLNQFTIAHNTMSVIKSVNIWENGDEEYCADMISQGLNQTDTQIEPNDLHIFVNCFTDSDFVG